MPTHAGSPTLDNPTRKKFAESRKRFQQSPRVAALVVDGEGTIKQVTPAARRVLEYGIGDPISPCFFSHVHGRNMYQVMRDVADMVCYGKPHASWLVRLRTGRGRWQWFRATVTNDLTGDANAIHVELNEL